jgi:hypothetical protein
MISFSFARAGMRDMRRIGRAIFALLALTAATTAGAAEKNPRKAAFEAGRIAPSASNTLPAFRLNPAVPNTNGACATALVVTPGAYTGNNSFAATDGASDCGGEGDVWFAFTPGETRAYVLSTDGSAIDTVLSVHSGCPGNESNEIVCEDDIPTEAISVVLDAGDTYSIRVAGFSGERGDYTLTIDASDRLFGSESLEVAVNEYGNFTLAVAGSDDFSGRLLYGHPEPWSGGTTLRVDSVDFWNHGFGENQIGTQISGPSTAPDGANVTVWEAGGVRLTQRLRLVPGGATSSSLGPLGPAPPLDNLLIEYTALNIDTIGHAVGVRTFMDTWLGVNDGAPFRVPGLGTVTHERELLGSEIPQFWTGFDSLANPDKIAQGTLIHGASRPPDRVVWGYWGTMNDTPWNYIVDPNNDLTFDSAVAVYWNPVPLAPGESLTVSTFYGLSAFNVDLTPPLAVGVVAPNALDAVNNRYAPNPFTVSASIEHGLTEITDPVTGIVVELNLPDSLSTANPITLPVGTLQPGESYVATWFVTVQPQVVLTGLKPQAAIGDPVDIDFTVTVASDGYPTKAVQRTITVPLLENAAETWTLYK